MPTAVTEGIRVTVEAVYLEDRSSPDDDTYAFAYVVAIANEGGTRVQLMRRHWLITDGNGEVREVEGEGVVGEQPVLEPGGVHRYASGAVLVTPVLSELMLKRTTAPGDAGRGHQLASIPGKSARIEPVDNAGGRGRFTILAFERRFDAVGEVVVEPHRTAIIVGQVGDDVAGLNFHQPLLHVAGFDPLDRSSNLFDIV